MPTASKTHSRKSAKRILSVTVKKMYDESPDTSWLGEYSERRTSEFSIDRAHAEDCASVSPQAERASETLEHARQTIGEIQNGINSETDQEEWQAQEDAYNLLGELADEVTDCDCGERGDMQRHEYRYFNPSFNYVDKDGKPTDGLTPEEVRKYVRQDYERMESLNRGHWSFIGIRAEAEVQASGDVVQEITSGGLWGIESDSDREHVESVHREELANLKAQLLALGFSKRAIATAFKNVEHKDA